RSLLGRNQALEGLRVPDFSDRGPRQREPGSASDDPIELLRKALRERHAFLAPFGAAEEIGPLERASVIFTHNRLGSVRDLLERGTSVVGSGDRIETECDRAAAFRNAVGGVVVSGVLRNDGVPLRDGRRCAGPHKADRAPELSFGSPTALEKEAFVPAGR